MASCKKSNDSAKSASIVGKWYETKVILHQSENNGPVVSDTTYLTDKSTYVQFNSNGSGSSTEDGSTTNFNYTVSGNSLTITPNSDNEINTITALTANSFVLHTTSYYTTNGVVYSDIIDDYFTK